MLVTPYLCQLLSFHPPFDHSLGSTLQLIFASTAPFFHSLSRPFNSTSTSSSPHPHLTVTRSTALAHQQHDDKRKQGQERQTTDTKHLSFSSSSTSSKRPRTIWIGNYTISCKFDWAPHNYVTRIDYSGARPKLAMNNTADIGSQNPVHARLKPQALSVASFHGVGNFITSAMDGAHLKL